MPLDMPFAAEVAGAIITLVVVTLATVTIRIVRGEDKRATLPSDFAADFAAVLERIDRLSKEQAQRADNMFRSISHQIAEDCEAEITRTAANLEKELAETRQHRRYIETAIGDIRSDLRVILERLPHR